MIDVDIFMPSVLPKFKSWCTQVLITDKLWRRETLQTLFEYEADTLIYPLSLPFLARAMLLTREVARVFFQISVFNDFYKYKRLLKN